MKPKERIIRLLVLLLSRPYHFSKKDLQIRFGLKSVDPISDDFKAIEFAGLTIEFDPQTYRYAVLPERGFRELNYLQPLTEEDKTLIKTALEYSGFKQKLYLSRKLESLYDFQKLGLRALSRPALDKIDQLTGAKKGKVRAVLKQYHSNSGSIRDRIVEPFHIDAELDTLQALDVEDEELSSKHFLLSRIGRVELTQKAWQYEGLQVLKSTDVFRIVNNQQVAVHLEMNVRGYNALLKSYPQAQSAVTFCTSSGIFQFKGKVNARFLGILNFIMGNAKHVTIIEPEALKNAARQAAQEILNKYHKE